MSTASWRPSSGRFRYRLLCAFCAGATLLPAGAARALEVLEEVIVVAQKRPQDMQIVPIAVTAFSGDDLVKSAVRDAFDLNMIAPALEVRQGGSANRTRFRIRSIGTTSDNFGLESAVGLYVDGVYRARQGSMVNNLVDIASVEVLRGPQGTLFGRNTLAGAVLVNTVAPGHGSRDGFAEVTAGNYDLIDISAAASFGSPSDQLVFRAAGFGTMRDGYVDDIRLGNNTIYDRDRWGLRLQALYTPGDRLSVRVVADHSEIDEVCCAALVLQDNLRPVSLPQGVEGYVGTDEVVRSLGGTVLSGNQFYNYKTAQSFLPVSANEDGGVSVTVDWESSDFALTSITAYRSHDSHDRTDVDAGDLDTVASDAVAWQDAFTQELRISGDTARLSYVAGLYYFRQNLNNRSTTTIGEDINGVFSHTFAYFAGSNGQLPLEAVPLFPLPPLPLFPPNSGARNRMRQEHRALAVFGQGDFSLSDRWMLTTGLRYTVEDKVLDGVFSEGTAPDYNDGVTALPIVLEQFHALAPRAPVNESLSDDRVTGTVRLTWFPTDDAMAYLSYATGYKAGGTNTQRINPELDYVFDPETSQALELGLKMEFPRQRLRMNLALHYTEIEDLQINVPTPNGVELQNAGEFDIWGGELELSWYPLRNLRVFGAYAWTDGENRSFENDSCWIAARFHTTRPDPDDPSGGTATGTCSRTGNDLAFNPDFLSLAASQEFGITEGVVGSLSLEYSHRGKTTISSRDRFLEIPAYDLVNLRLAIEFRRQDLTLSLWSRNLTDEHYRMTGFNPIGQTGRVVATPLEPFTYGVTLRKRF